jgi:hypothetical protein
MFQVGDKVMQIGLPNNPEFEPKDVGVPEPQFGVVYTVSSVGVSMHPGYIGEPVITLKEIQTVGNWSYAAKYFNKVPPRAKEKLTVALTAAK